MCNNNHHICNNKYNTKRNDMYIYIYREEEEEERIIQIFVIIIIRIIIA